MAMRQLSGHDAGFLYTDTAHANANVSLLHIYDQSTAPGGLVRFKSILAQFERRLQRSPLFRQRLQRVPLGLDHPYWVDDEHFDLEYHVRHLALPKPGDWRQFCIQAARIHARALDLDRPLWEAYVIEGLDSFLDLPAGSFALLLKTHLAAADLAQAAGLSTLLHDDSATPPAGAPPEPWFADSPPGELSLVLRGLKQSATAPLRLAGPLARAARQVAPAAVALASEMLLRPEQLPPSRFNSVVSPHRVFETRRFTEAEFNAIRALVPGASVDDAVLAVIGGALRRYLDAQGELPEGASLTAILPQATVKASASGAAPAWRHLHLGTDIAGAVPRLAALRAQTAAAPDAVARTFGAPVLAEVGEQSQAALLGWSRRWLNQATARLGRRTPPANAVIHALPVPPGPLFLCGAHLTYISAILPISDGLGLALAVTRYDGRLVISPTSCRELMPDPEAFALCLRDSFQEYLALVQQREATAAERRARRRRVRLRRVPQAAREAADEEDSASGAAAPAADGVLAPLPATPAPRRASRRGRAHPAAPAG